MTCDSLKKSPRYIYIYTIEMIRIGLEMRLDILFEYIFYFLGKKNIFWEGGRKQAVTIK